MAGVVFTARAERKGNDPARVRSDIFQGFAGDALEQPRNDDRVRKGGLAELLGGDQNFGFSQDQ